RDPRAGRHDDAHPRCPFHPGDPPAERGGRGTVRGSRVDERTPLADRPSSVPPAGEKPRRRGAGRTLPAPERRFPALGQLLPTGDPPDASSPAVAPRGGAKARTHARDRAERQRAGAGRSGVEGADGRDPEGTRRPSRGPERRVLPGERGYPGTGSQSNFGRLLTP